MNQAIGRVVRHVDDWGAVLLADTRCAMHMRAPRGMQLPIHALPFQIRELARKKVSAAMVAFLHADVSAQSNAGAAFVNAGVQFQDHFKRSYLLFVTFLSSCRYDTYGRGQGDLAQFMKAQVVTDHGDEFLESACVADNTRIATKTAGRLAGSSSMTGDRQPSAPVLKTAAIVPVVAASPSAAIRFITAIWF